MKPSQKILPSSNIEKHFNNISIGDRVRVNIFIMEGMNPLSYTGEVMAIINERITLRRYHVKFTTSTGTINEAWFREDEITPLSIERNLKIDVILSGLG